MSGILRYLQTLAGRDACRDAADRDLLRRFVAARDEAAFAALVERHGPLVLAACRRVLDDPADAEDALQATFLVLVRKADTIRAGDSVGSWLYGVAIRLARKARRQQARRRAVELAASRDARTDALDELSVAEARRLLDEEIAALPEKYRAPLVLCCLQGKTRDEAAAELGWVPGAVKIRLERGRERLRQRLLRRGVTPASATLLAALEPAAALPTRVAAGVLEVALSGTGSPAVLALAATGSTLPLWLASVTAGLVLAGGLAWGLWPAAEPAAVPEPPVVVAEPPPVEPPPVPVAEGPPFVAAYVEVEEQTVVLRRQEVNTRYLLLPETTVAIDGRPARFADLKPRARVVVVPSADGTTVLRVEQRP